MNPNQTFEQVDESWKTTRLTCAYDPLADVADPRFNFDDLLEDKILCYCGPDCEKCKAYSGLEEDRYPSMCEICYNKFTDHEGYCDADGTRFCCNMCAEQEAKKDFCKKCEEPFGDKTIPNEYDGEFCEVCYYLVPNKYQYYADDEEELLEKYSAEQREQLIKYAEKHNLTIEESIDYQTHCHCCGKTVEDGFDESNHQYCKEKCFERCEDYWYHCFRGDDCKVCGIWEYHARRDSLTAYDIELSELAPVLATIDCFKELQVYGQLYECLEDLVDYFDSDRQWRYDFV